MKGYWMRVMTAFFLLKLASSVMKQAEKVLATNMETRDAPPTIDGEVAKVEVLNNG